MSVFTDAIANFLGPIKDLLDDNSISEIMINGPHDIYVEKSGKIVKTDNQFATDDNLMSAMRAIAQAVGKTFDKDNPRLDAHLPDGSRIAAVISPISQNGTTVSIRKFFEEKIVLKDLIDWGAISKDGARFLDICIFLGKNLIVSGGTGSGKTTLLNVLASRVSGNERILLIEDTKELKLEEKHLVHLVTRKADVIENTKGVEIKDLLHSAMRLRPDRIIVGEVRSGEALDLINAMNTGHDGSMGTVHANNPSESLLRLETLCLMSGTAIPHHSLKLMISNAVQVVVQTKRFSDGKRRVSHISEVLGLKDNGEFKVRNIFKWVQKDKLDSGELIGELIACHYLPTFFHEIKVNKLPFPSSKFEMPAWAKKQLKNLAA